MLENSYSKCTVRNGAVKHQATIAATLISSVEDGFYDSIETVSAFLQSVTVLTVTVVMDVRRCFVISEEFVHTGFILSTLMKLGGMYMLLLNAKLKRFYWFNDDALFH